MRDKRQFFKKKHELWEERSSVGTGGVVTVGAYFLGAISGGWAIPIGLLCYSP